MQLKIEPLRLQMQVINAAEQIRASAGKWRPPDWQILFNCKIGPGLSNPHV